MEGIATAVASFPAEPGRVYSLLADYNSSHHSILPANYFKKLEVTAGGVGAGTRTRVEMQMLGRTFHFEQAITEPEPGRVLVETDPTGSSTTRFVVDAIENGRSSRVLIETRFKTEHEGLRGRIERWIMASTLRRIYREQLALIAAHATAAGSPKSH
jgi:polyketide cyclase/dehydrase/lipid transport protein